MFPVQISALIYTTVIRKLRKTISGFIRVGIVPNAVVICPTLPKIIETTNTTSTLTISWTRRIIRAATLNPAFIDVTAINASYI